MRIESEHIRLLGDWAPGTAAVANLPFDGGYLVNLEGPIVPSGSDVPPARPKAGPSLHNRLSPSPGAEGVAVLANNHIMDFGERGLQSSLDGLQAQGLQAVGAGLDRESAEAPLIIDWRDRRVGVLARCETQFGIAHGNGAGVAALGSGLFEQIRALKTQVDHVIVSVHAAAETVPWPSPQRQSLFRAMVDAGADVIHGHHAHVPQGWERYRSGWIFYGLGNFCVDPAKWSLLKHALWSVIPVLSLSEAGIDVSIETGCVSADGANIVLRGSTTQEHEQYLRYLEKCNSPLEDSDLLEGVWQEASITLYERYFSQWLGFKKTAPQVVKGVLRETASSLRHLRPAPGGHSAMGNRERDQMLLRYHLFACDSHRDAIATATGVLGGELPDLRTPRSSALIAELMADR